MKYSLLAIALTSQLSFAQNVPPNLDFSVACNAPTQRIDNVPISSNEISHYTLYLQIDGQASESSEAFQSPTCQFLVSKYIAPSHAGFDYSVSIKVTDTKGKSSALTLPTSEHYNFESNPPSLPTNINTTVNCSGDCTPAIN